MREIIAAHVEFPGNGFDDMGYLARPKESGGPGVVVIQEWWGLEAHIKDVTDFNDTRPHIYRADAAQDAWKRTLRWFEAHLR